MKRIFFREVVHLYVDNNNIEKPKKRTDKLPFAVFISPRKDEGNTADYKEVFTEIISDRIKEKYK